MCIEYVYWCIYVILYIYIYIYPGGLRPDSRAPGDFAEEGAFQNICLLRFVYVFWYFWIRFFVCFWRRFRQGGGVPPDARGGAKVSLGDSSGGQVCFVIDFCWFGDPFNDPLGSHVLTFSTLIFIVVSGRVQDKLKTRFYRIRLHFRHMKALCPLLFPSRFLRGVFITFTLPGGTPKWRRRPGRTPLWGAGNSACEHAGGGYHVGFSTFQHLQALCSPLSSD